MKRAAGELLARAPGTAVPASLPLPQACRGRAPPVPPRPSQSFLPRPQPSRIPPLAFSWLPEPARVMSKHGAVSEVTDYLHLQ